jgi:hypothetical protein
MPFEVAETMVAHGFSRMSRLVRVEAKQIGIEYGAFIWPVRK